MTYDDEMEGGPALMVRCRGQGGSSAILPVLDISAGGFLVPYKGWEALPGERVLATIEGFGVRPSQLIWVEDNLAGVGFDEPLHEAVYDLLRNQLDGSYVNAGAEALRKEQEEEERNRPQRRSLA